MLHSYNFVAVIIFDQEMYFQFNFTPRCPYANYSDIATFTFKAKKAFIDKDLRFILLNYIRLL